MNYTKLIGLTCILLALFSACKTKTSTVASGRNISQQQQSVAFYKDSLYIDSLIGTLPEESEVGISIYNLTTNKSLYTHRNTKLARPASTMKLLTAITTLSHPDGNKPFTTDVYYSGSINKDTLNGDLYIKGGMDPEFDDAAMDSLVAQVTKQPFKVVKGHIIGDISMKDSLYWGEGWMWDDAPYEYQPHLSPLLFCKGLVDITALPDSTKNKAHISVYPNSDYFTIYNLTKSNLAEKSSFEVQRDFVNQSNIIVASGNVCKKTDQTITVSHGEQYFLHTFTERLRKVSNIKITKGYTYTYNPQIDYSIATKIASYSTDCEKVVKQMLKASDNLNAEAMLYRLSAINGNHPATASSGVAAIQKKITELGLNSNTYRIVDGSGLSYHDLLTPQLEMAFLKYAYAHPDLYQIIYRCVPISGVDGTLRRRMKNLNIHAKTGSNSLTNTLAGYLTNKKGEVIAFSIMNQSILDESKAQDFQNAICTKLCE